MTATIDDFYDESVTNIRYTEGWQYGPNCTTCTIIPEVDKLFDRTWHEVTVFPGDPYPENLTIPFNGTAISVFCVVPNFTNSSSGAISFVNVSFELDGVVQPHNYEHQPDDSNETFLYNITVYNTTSLQPGHHTLVLTPQKVNNPSYLGFDWASYGNGDVISPSTSSSAIPQSSSQVSRPPLPVVTTSPAAHTAVGAIVGGVVGGVLGVLVAVLIGLLLYRRARQKRNLQSLIDTEEKAGQRVKPTISPLPLSSVSQISGSDQSGQAPAGLRMVDGVYERTIHLRHATSTESRSLSPSAMSTSTFPLTLHSPKSSDGSSAVIRSTSSISPFLLTASEQASSRMSPLGSVGSSQIAELSRHIRVLEQTVSDLRRRQSTDHRATTTLLASNQPSLRGTLREDVELRQEIATLQQDVERLRAEQAMLLQEAPPAYEPREDEGTAGPRPDSAEGPQPDDVEN